MQLFKCGQISYSHLHKYEEEFTNIVHHTLAQYTLKEGMRRYKEQGKNAEAAEMKQLHDKLAFKPFKKKSLTS